MALRKPRDIEFGRPGGAGVDPDALVDGVALIRTAEGSGVIVPRALAKLRGPAATAAAQLQHQARVRADAQERIDHLVDHCREEGLSWGSIGWCLGTTSQAVQQRYGNDGRP